MYTILITGAGQLGSRYLQGLANCQQTLSIIVHDISEDSLIVAKNRWNEVTFDKSFHHINFISTLKYLPDEIDLVIVSTSSHVRSRLIKEIVQKTIKIKYFILEKVLGQNGNQIDSIIEDTKTAQGVWVNTPLRAMSWYNEINKAMSDSKGRFNSIINGGITFALASNAIHYLDLLCWFLGETVDNINTDKLDKVWVKSKRSGFWDIYGTLNVTFSDGSHLTISSQKEELSKVTININYENNESWIINEFDCKAFRNDGLCIEGRIEFQSELTPSIVDEILSKGSCRLPSLSESAVIHKIFLKEMLSHWNLNMPRSLTKLPIT